MLAVTSAILLGFLVMLIPLFMWHQVNFPHTPPTLSGLRKEAMDTKESYGAPMDDSSMLIFHAMIIVSFVGSLALYLFFRRGV